MFFEKRRTSDIVSQFWKNKQFIKPAYIKKNCAQIYGQATIWENESIC